MPGLGQVQSFVASAISDHFRRQSGHLLEPPSQEKVRPETFPVYLFLVSQ
jgi:hypothetical protein